MIILPSSAEAYSPLVVLLSFDLFSLFVNLIL